MEERIQCGEWGSVESERWSREWAPAAEDASRLAWLADQRLLDLKHCPESRVRIAGRNFCGRMRLPSGALVEIASKVSLLPLIQWLAFTETLPELEEWDDSPTLGPDGNLVDALTLFFIQELAHLTRFHGRHGYAQASTETAQFRGRLDGNQLARVAPRLPRLPCTYRERTMNTQANRVLARALDAAWRLADIPRLPEASRCTLDWLTNQWSAIERDLPSLDQALGQVLSRPPVGYRRAIRLARLLLKGVVVDAAGGDGGDIFLIKMSTVWEEGLRRILARWAQARGYRFGDAKDRTKRWEDATNRDEPNRWLAVDAILLAKDRVVFDAKYKRGYGDESRDDRFQMAAYAMGFGASAAVLVYPTAVADERHRCLLRTAFPGVASRIVSLELPMARGPEACGVAADRALDELLR